MRGKTAKKLRKKALTIYENTPVAQREETSRQFYQTLKSDLMVGKQGFMKFLDSFQ